MSTSAIEVVTFKGLAGVTGPQMLAAAQAVAPRLAEMPGFVSRQLGANASGQFVDIVQWRDLGSAQAAAQLLMSCPRCQPFFALIDPASVNMAHFETA